VTEIAARLAMGMGRLEGSLNAMSHTKPAAEIWLGSSEQ
jgi:hypothetical protein